MNIDMSGSFEHRLKVLEQTLQIIQKEINEALGEIQIVLQGVSRGTKMALEVLDQRITEVQKEVNQLNGLAVRDNEQGREL